MTRKAALKTLKGIFIKEKLTSVDQRKTYIARQLTGTYKSYHYYYSVAVGEGSNVQYAGAFQSPLISKTFAEHLKAIESIPQAQHIADRPTGAIVLAILAVHRALMFYSTGSEVVPGGLDGTDSFRVYQQAVWGDKSTFNIDRVSATQWDRIITSAHTHIVKSERTVKSLPAPVSSEPRSDEDWEVPDIDPETFSITTFATEKDEANIAKEEFIRGEPTQTSETMGSDGLSIGNPGSDSVGREGADLEDFEEESGSEFQDNDETRSS
ncbi:hypothetical protein F5890DRAFT_1636729 [Lentinula detonsa]|uniref:Uncharacterized protein n=1 Tax=Lentinula detonsa TaxID=2804962 RepID=A0AA38UMT6_9AGAR|nr:hypothetical protein F5890DRAFT_1636729 [Lentinula detonsa]